MKNLIKIALLLVVAVAMCACSGGNTPSGVAEKAMKCIIDEDYEGYVDLIYMNEKAEMDKEKLDEQKKQYAAMLKEKMTKSAEKRKENEVGKGTVGRNIGKRRKGDSDNACEIRQRHRRDRRHKTAQGQDWKLAH